MVITGDYKRVEVEPAQPAYYDIKPETPVCKLQRRKFASMTFRLEDVLPVVGMDAHYVRRVVGKKENLSIDDVYELIEQDAFQETFIPRSMVCDFLIARGHRGNVLSCTKCPIDQIVQGDAKDLIPLLPDQSIQCVVTSTPYWAMRVYDQMVATQWADGEECSLGLEQTPEGFIRHSVEILYRLFPKISDSGSIWWNIMDTYNTRTQIRSSAVEALRAMQGKDRRTWKDYKYKRYSGGPFFFEGWRTMYDSISHCRKGFPDWVLCKELDLMVQEFVAPRATTI